MRQRVGSARRGGVRAALAATLLLVPVVATVGAGTSSSHADLGRAGVDLARKAAALQALDGFTTEFPALTQALSGLPLVPNGDGRGALLRDLRKYDANAAADLATLQQDGVSVASEAAATLTALTASDLAAVTSGHPTQQDPGRYLAGLQELLLLKGQQVVGVPDPGLVRRALAKRLGVRVGTGPGPEPPLPDSSGGATDNTVGIAIGIAAIVLLTVITVYAIRSRRTPAGRPALPPHPPPGLPATTAASMQPVLEASRRLTAGTVGDDLLRAIVREALGLAPSRAGALVVRRSGVLVLGHETHPGMLDPAGFGAGVIERAADTGRPVVEVVYDDVSFRDLPCRIAVIPLVGNGRVDALLVGQRDASLTFTTAEQQQLNALAPVAAAALTAAARTQAAVDASLIDPLTGVGNRRQLDQRLGETLQAAGGRPTSFCMVDLDHFKSVNDTHGHPAGDALLRGVCDVIRETVRPTDGVYRYGGEEFCVLFPGTGLDEAREVAERVRVAIADRHHDVGGGVTLTATASLGVATTVGVDAAELVAHADGALYAAKHGGRNQVRVADSV